MEIEEGLLGSRRGSVREEGEIKEGNGRLNEIKACQLCYKMSQ
jgi:hypothetical protein